MPTASFVHLAVLFSVALVRATDKNPLLLETSLEKKLSDQIALEYEAFFLYEQMAAFYSQANQALFGFAAFFQHAADEEIHHAREFTEFMVKRQAAVVLKNIKFNNDVPTSWNTTIDALQLAYDREVAITKAIIRVQKEAGTSKDTHLQEFLDHFVKEQYSAAFKLKALITRLDKKGPTVEYFIDKELAEKPDMH